MAEAKTVVYLSERKNVSRVDVCTVFFAVVLADASDAEPDDNPDTDDEVSLAGSDKVEFDITHSTDHGPWTANEDGFVLLPVACMEEQSDLSFISFH